MSVVVVETTRGPLVETVHRGDAAVVDGAGRLLFSVGNPEKVTFWRSAAKPVQALPIIETGAAGAFGFTSEHLAVFAASHNGEPVHVQAVQDALARSGLDASLLQCGVHPPEDREAAQALAAAGLAPESVHNNCSGKHTGMLALARHLGLPVGDYLDPGSHLQRLILAGVAEMVSVPPEDIAIGVDGCGVPVFGLPLRNMALAFARLADPGLLPPVKASAALRIRDAMLDHPYLVAGRRRICSDLTGLPGRRFVAKSGAEGVYSVGILPEAVSRSPVLRNAGPVGGVGITVKVEDGDAHVRNMMVAELLRQIGVLTSADWESLSRYGPRPVKNHAGKVVGERRTVFQLKPYLEEKS